MKASKGSENDKAGRKGKEMHRAQHTESEQDTAEKEEMDQLEIVSDSSSDEEEEAVEDPIRDRYYFPYDWCWSDVWAYLK